MPVAIKALKKENNGLRNLSWCIIKGTEESASENRWQNDGGDKSMLAAIFSCRSSGGGFEEHEFLGLECDDLNNFRGKIFEPGGYIQKSR